MTRLLVGITLPLCLALASLLGLAACGAEGEEDTPVRAKDGVVVIRFGEQIGPGSLSLLRRAIDVASERRATIVLELDTPGGEVELMWRITQAISRARDADVRVVAYVDTHALSAGALVAMACDGVYVAPNSVIGAAEPIVQTVGGAGKVNEKYLSAFRAEARSLAEKNGRPGALIAGMVDQSLDVLLIDDAGLERIVDGTEWDDLRTAERDVRLISTIADRESLVSLSADQAVQFGVADGRADNLTDLLEVSLSMMNVEPERLEPTAAESAATFLSSIAPLLLVAGIMFAVFELQAPGFGVFGSLSILSFATLLLGRYLTGLAGLEHFLLIVIGLGLIVTEILFIPGSLIAGIPGAILLITGVIWSQLGQGMPLSSAMDRALAFDAVYSTVVWTSLAVVAGMLVTRFLPNTPGLKHIINAPDVGDRQFGSALGKAEVAGTRVGALGKALTDLRPVGKVELDSEPGTEFEAQVEGGSLSHGSRVRVIAARTGRLVVERHETDRAQPESRS